MSRKSSSRLRNASQRAWPSSMIVISTRPASGSSRPFSAAATGARRRGHRSGRRVARFAIVGIGHRARSACCAGIRRACTDRCRPDARRCRAPYASTTSRACARHVRHREHVREAQVGRVEPDAQRVAVDDLEPRHRRVVVEVAASSSRLRARLVAALELAFEQPHPRRLDRGVEEALEAVGEVGGGQLAAACP